MHRRFSLQDNHEINYVHPKFFSLHDHHLKRFSHFWPTCISITSTFSRTMLEFLKFKKRSHAFKISYRSLMVKKSKIDKTLHNFFLARPQTLMGNKLYVQNMTSWRKYICAFLVLIKLPKFHPWHNKSGFTFSSVSIVNQIWGTTIYLYVEQILLKCNLTVSIGTLRWLSENFVLVVHGKHVCCHRPHVPNVDFRHLCLNNV
jgi:hypothetical protein